MIFGLLSRLAFSPVVSAGCHSNSIPRLVCLHRDTHATTAVISPSHKHPPWISRSLLSLLIVDDAGCNPPAGAYIVIVLAGAFFLRNTLTSGKHERCEFAKFDEKRRAK